MKEIIKTYEDLEVREKELVKDGYKLDDISNHAIIFSKFISGIKSEVKLIPAFWNVNKGLI